MIGKIKNDLLDSILETFPIEFSVLFKEILDVDAEYLEYSYEELYTLFSYLGEIEYLDIVAYGSGARVTIYYWSFIGSSNSEIDGHAELKIPRDTMPAEIFGVKAIFQGNDYYKEIEGTGSFTIVFDSDFDGIDDQDEINI